jgi:aryl-alcohol dehydrogenase-like predicted oxidoreductase
VPIEEVVWAMHHLIAQGKILYWGTSEWSGVEIMEAHRVAQHYGLIGPSVEQPQYNLFERNKIENEYLMVYKTVGLGTTIWSPLASGLLSGKYNKGIPADSRFAIPGFEWLRDRLLQEQLVAKAVKIAELAGELSITPSQLSIAWCVKNPHVTTTILGATKKEQLIENLDALSAVEKLTPEVLQRIETIVQTKPILPEY